MNRNLPRCVPSSRHPQDPKATTWDQRVPAFSGLQTVHSLWHGPFIVPHQDPATLTWQPLLRPQAVSGRPSSRPPLNQQRLYGLGLRVDTSMGGASSGRVHTKAQQSGSSGHHFAQTRGGWWRKAKSKTAATSVEAKSQVQDAHRMNPSATFDHLTNCQPIAPHHAPASMRLRSGLDLPPHLPEHTRREKSVFFQPKHSTYTPEDIDRLIESLQSSMGGAVNGKIHNPSGTTS